MVVRKMRSKWGCVIGALMGAMLLLVSCRQTPRRPNFVFILIDDLGWADTGVYGSPFYETPHIDGLAASGMRFTQAYAAASVCSPTRASLMTGKYPARLHITNWIGGAQKGRLLPPEYMHYLPLEEVTIAEALQQAGYATAHIGKWHLGDKPYLPQFQGFALNIAGHHAGQPGSYFYPYKGKRKGWEVPDLEGGHAGEYLTDRLTDEAIKFVAANRERPFFLYLSHYAVHTPLQAKPDLTEHFAAKAQALAEMDGPAFVPESDVAVTKQRQDHAVYAAMVASVDESVGRLVAALDSLDLTTNTVIIFTSDNGGLSTLPTGRTWMPTSNAPLRAGKGWLYEGGIREPLIVFWPDHVRPGSVSDVLALSTDFYPTILEMAGLPLRPAQHQDGLSLLPVLQGTGTLARDRLFWHFPHYHGSGHRPAGAMRAGDFKIVEWFETGRVELYDLQRDPGEHTDLAHGRPALADSLRKLLHGWRADVRAAMPTPNPDWRKE